MRKGKRAMDLLLAVPALIVLSPLFVGLCLWVKLDSPGAVFFRQKRVGISSSAPCGRIRRRMCLHIF